MIDLITYKFYKTVFPATRDKQILKDNGITSYITDGRAILTDYLLSKVVGGVYLQVCEVDFENVQRIMRKESEKISLPKRVHTVENPESGCTCPKCSSNHIVRDHSEVYEFISFEIKRLLCNYCGNKFQQSGDL